MSTSFDLDRFVTAQAPVVDAVRAELAAGRKTSHWMWFVFPQLRGLGRSATAAHFGLEGAEEARAYLAHPLLGPRLREAAALVLGLRGRSAHDIFGTPDDLKLRSCMSLFDAVGGPGDDVFRQVLERFFDGVRDPATLALLAAARDAPAFPGSQQDEDGPRPA